MIFGLFRGWESSNGLWRHGLRRPLHACSSHLILATTSLLTHLSVSVHERGPFVKSKSKKQAQTKKKKKKHTKTHNKTRNEKTKKNLCCNCFHPIVVVVAYLVHT